MALDKEEMSERVIAIAENLIEAGGAENLKARTIATEAGIAVGSIYNLFRDIDDLHRAVNMRLLDRLGEAGAAAMAELKKAGVTDTRQCLLALARAYAGFVEAHPASWPALLAFNRRQPAHAEPDAYEARLSDLLQIIARVLADGRFGLDENRLRIAARTLWSSVHGIVTSGYAANSAGRKADETWEQIELLVAVFIKGLERGGTLDHAGTAPS
ncbi:MAG: TetR/AcrR family transcriptional regulator [Mesorhizobium sp.]|uniref:TetR/AcrR family transcriptional regulator n=1 Tax=Mesorhizobium sp. TaxID=1871066 RepID=UPI000FD48B21|nr:TetR/AcrR family transcriptional regulator [Mesorhizobium sp.]RVC61738.1 TetR/AcrR family transcriptional regulator [Mesorhizobium sp. M4B.F.Ca.ET.088.02.2.1]RWC97361.1 MAG: TetR/AcrR family transcriptional regulator [Mesorhizobium sp.]RWF27318.1 MAG: TetR/AcrR family transcriptional regulator [Mesorhizobium sp.]RWF37603.1 MAG: TetR/AcrR family transcriptional regulator [Mesorhizobium sp.]TIW71525.1 MAG: TetR/AcrR family transcriptional regulator [Mesorhizobium sp.]